VDCGGTATRSGPVRGIIVYLSTRTGSRAGRRAIAYLVKEAPRWISSARVTRSGGLPETRAVRKECRPRFSPKLRRGYHRNHGNGITLDSSFGLGRGVVGGMHPTRANAYRNSYCRADTNAQAHRPDWADPRGLRHSDGNACCDSRTNVDSDSDCNPWADTQPKPDSASDSDTCTYAHTNLDSNPRVGSDAYIYACDHARRNLCSSPYLDSDSNPYLDSNSNPYLDSNSNLYLGSDTYVDSCPCRDSNSYLDSDTYLGCDSDRGS